MSPQPLDIELMKVEDVAKILKVSVGSLYNMHSKGEGPPAFKIGGRLRWRKSAVEAWIASLPSV